MTEFTIIGNYVAKDDNSIIVSTNGNRYTVYTNEDVMNDLIGVRPHISIRVKGILNGDRLTADKVAILLGEN